MQKVYNKKTKNLAFYKQKADSSFWNKHWHDCSSKNQIVCQNYSELKYFLDKYCPDKEAKILEAGCGNARVVYFMNFYGYLNSYGIDYADKTVDKVKSFFPNLKISKQDVEKTIFVDNFFDMYLSFGVIEHSHDGYHNIISEAKRIVKREGYFVFSFPHISLLRKIKILLGVYSVKELPQKFFYQYCFDYKNVVKEFKRKNFILIDKMRYDGIKGFKDEFRLFKPVLQLLYDYSGESKTIMTLKAILNKFLTLFASHIIFLVFKNDNKS